MGTFICGNFKGIKRYKRFDTGMCSSYNNLS